MKNLHTLNRLIVKGSLRSKIYSHLHASNKFVFPQNHHLNNSIGRNNYFQYRSNSHKNAKSSVAGTKDIGTSTSMATASTLEYSYATDPYLLPKSFGVGATAGFLGSLAGMGGGFIIIPLLTLKKSIQMNQMKFPLGLGISQHLAHGTSLFAVCATGIAGGIGFGLQDIHLESVAALAVAGMATARMGALAISRLSDKQLKIGLGMFMVCVAPLVPLKPYIAQKYGGVVGEHSISIDTEDDNGKTQNTKNIQVRNPIQTPLENATQNLKIQVKNNEHSVWDRIFLPGFVGLGSGFVSGLFGVGGGAVTVPALTIATDISHHQALGTSLCTMSLPALAGTITHYQRGNVALGIAVPLACGAFVGGYTGGRFGSKLPEDKLRWGFFALLMSLGTRNLVKAGAFMRR